MPLYCRYKGRPIDISGNHEQSIIDGKTNDVKGARERVQNGMLGKKAMSLIPLPLATRKHTSAHKSVVSSLYCSDGDVLVRIQPF